MDFVFVHHYFGSVDQLLFFKSQLPLELVGLPFLYTDEEGFTCENQTFFGVFKSRKEFCTFLSATLLQVKNLTACGSTARANNNLTDMLWH